MAVAAVCCCGALLLLHCAVIFVVYCCGCVTSHLYYACFSCFKGHYRPTSFAQHALSSYRALRLSVLLHGALLRVFPVSCYCAACCCCVLRFSLLLSAGAACCCRELLPCARTLSACYVLQLYSQLLLRAVAVSYCCTLRAACCSFTVTSYCELLFCRELLLRAVVVNLQSNTSSDSPAPHQFNNYYGDTWRSCSILTQFLMASATW